MSYDTALTRRQVLLGTLAAAAKLIEQAGGIVSGIGVIVELAFLDGRHRLKDYDVHSVISYDSE